MVGSGQFGDAAASAFKLASQLRCMRPARADVKCDAPLTSSDAQPTLAITSHHQRIMPLNCTHVISG